MSDSSNPTPPQAREQFKAGPNPLILKFENSSGSKKTSSKSYFNVKYPTIIMLPGIGEVAIEWNVAEQALCPGIFARIASSKTNDDGLWETSATMYELEISPSACPLYISVFEESGVCDKDGESRSSRDSYWIEVVQRDIER
jgi:hypothetical protein